MHAGGGAVLEGNASLTIIDSIWNGNTVDADSGGKALSGIAGCCCLM